MLRSLKLQKKIVAIWSLFSLLLNMAQPAFVALTLAPVILPSSVQAEDVVVGPSLSPEPSVEPSVSPTVEPSATPVESIAPSAEPTPEASIEPVPSVEPSAEPSSTPTPAPEDIPTNPEPGQDSSPAPPSSDNPSESAAPSTEPTPSPSITPVPNLNEQLNISIVDNTAAESIEEFDLTVTESGSATLATDKADYAPTDTAIITGSGFLANTTYRLTVFSTDEPATSTTVDVTTDADGTLFYAYQLDGIYRPNYKVEAFLSSTLVATTSFTDAPPASNPATTIDQCQNGGIGDPLQPCSETAPFSAASGYGYEGNANANHTNSHWNEGEFVPLRIVATDYSAGAGNIQFSIDVTKGGKHAYDYIGSFDATETTGSSTSTHANHNNPVTDIIGGASPTVADSVGTIPAATLNSFPVACGSNTFVGSQAAGQVSAWGTNGPLTVTYVSQNVGSSDCTTTIQVAWTATKASFGGTIVIAYGAHIARQADWGTGNSAISISGSPYHTSLVQYTSGGETKGIGQQDAKLAASAVIPPGSITIIKDAVPNDPQDFLFTTNGVGLSNFTLDDDGDIANTYSNIKTFSSIGAGTYSVSETAVPGWTQTSAICNDGSPVSSISLAEGEDITCTFNNTLQSAHLTLVKTVTNDNGGSAAATDWTLSATGPTNISGVTGSVAVTNAEVNGGTYDLSESGPSGYTASSWSCIGGSLTGDQVTLAAGESATCTIHNDDNAPNLTLIKVVANNNGGSASESAWTLTAAGPTGFSGAGPSVSNGASFDAGTYDLSESGPTGYSASSWVCDGGTQNDDETVTLALGESATCTITNNDDPGTLIVTKITIPTDTQTAFAVTATGSGTIQGSATRDIYDGAPIEYTVDAGTYDVTESVPAGWSETNNTCDDIVIANGGEGSCTIENTKLGSISGFKFNDLNGDGIWDADEPGASGWLISLLDDEDNVLGTYTTDVNGFYSFDNLLPSTYSLIENLLAGWTQTSAPVDVILSAGEESEDNNFLNFENVSITACKVADPDGALGTETGRTIVSGWQMDLFKNDVLVGDTQITGNDGCYTWTNLGPGSYHVNEENRPSWTSLNSNTHDFGTVQSGQIYSHTFINTQSGSIVVIKQTIPDGSLENFAFDASYHDENFLLTDGFIDLSGDLAPGTYSVAELPEAGWDLTSATCDDDSDPSSINLLAGEDVTCTFTNTQRGHIIVDKVTDPGQSPQSFDFVATGTDYDNFSLTDQAAPNDQELVPGTYGISETTLAGWDLTDTTCVSTLRDVETASNLELDPGETITCTFTNTALGNITVVKYNDHNGNGLKDDGDEVLGDTGVGAEVEATRWEMHLVGTGVNSYQWTGTGDPAVAGQVTFSDLMPNSFTLTEQIKTGWVQTNISCGQQGEVYDAANDNLSFDLSAGQDLTCYMGNQGRGTVTVNKNVDTDNDGQVDVFGSTDWLFELATADYTMGTTVPVAAGSYLLDEFQNSGYHFVSLFCDDVNQNGSTTTVNVGPGDDVVCTYTNARDTGAIIIHKIIDPDGIIEGEGATDDQFPGENWTVDVDGDSEDTSDPTSQTTSDVGSSTFSNLKTGTYNVLEAQQPGYELIDAYCDDENGNSDGETIYSVDLGKDETVNCTFINSPNSTLHGYKWHDVDQSGDPLAGLGEDKLSDWTISLYKDNGEGYDLVTSMDTDNDEHFGWYWFEHLFPGDYKICETLETGWQQTYPLDNDGCHLVTLPLDSSGPMLTEQILNAVYGPMYNFGNVQAEPVLRIQKSSDASGNKTPGDLVTYTLVVDLTGSALTGVTVTDVTPDGFDYVAGSWTADLNGSPLVVPEPDYASPGTWFLGDMVDGDVITLTYQAKIAADQDSGTYNDIAWAEGSSQGWGTVLALGHDSEYVDDIFVGTDVVINKVTPQTGSVDIEGEVLGAATELPATGAGTNWLYLALSLLITGLALILGGRRMRYLTVSLISAFSILISAPIALAADPDNNLSVRVEQPQSPTRLNEWKLSYSVLDRNLGTFPSVTCYVKKPGTGSAVQFDTTKVAVKDTGDNDFCQVNSAVMSNQGTYEFYVTATSGSDSENSSTVSVVYDTEGPDRPVSYSKEHPWACRYTIKFKTADDGGKTAWVEVFGSKSTSFNTDNGTRIGSVGIGSNQEGSLNHDLVGDDCNQTWYYVIRAFDSAGNQSAHLGDEVVTVNSGTASPTTAALVVTTAGRGGSLLGSDQADGDEGEVLGEAGDGEEQAESTEGDGLVAGATEAAQELVKNKSFWWIILVIIALRIVYGILRKPTKN